MNIQELHTIEKPVSAVSFFKGEEGSALALRIQQGHQLKKHITKVPALLICIEGEVVFENVQGLKKSLNPGDYVNIEPMVEHWVDGVVNSNLLLMK